MRYMLYLNKLSLLNLMYFVFCFLASTSTINLDAQHPVLDRVLEVRQRGQVFKNYDLFSYNDAIENLPQLRSDVLKGATLKINPNTLNQLCKQRPLALSLKLPLAKEGNFLQVDLVRVDLTTADFKVRTSEGNELSYSPGVHYRGILHGQENASVALSFFEDDVIGMIGNQETSNWVLGKLDDPQFRNTYALYKEEDLKVEQTFSCGAAEVSKEIRTIEQKQGELRAVTPVNKIVKVYLECEYDLVLEKGGAAGATNFITGIFNIVSMLYQNEGITTVVSEIFTWTTQDTYPTTSTSSALVAFRSARSSFNGNIAHLVSRGKPTGGGVAYVPGVCNGYGYAYSWVQSTYLSFPTYSWTVNVIAHEMGHNLGSSHTHDCVWNGNNTPIDGCGPAAGYNGSGSCAALPAPTAPFKGTIMSYCHLVSGIGIDFNLGFGQQPGDRIRSIISAGACLTSTDPNTCSTPTTAQLSTSNLAATSATLGNSATGINSYDWRYRLVGAANWTDLAATATGVANLSGLVASSNYEFQSSIQCTSGGTWTAWSAAKTFSTTAVSNCVAPTTAQLSATNLAVTTATLNSSQTGLVAYDWRYRLVGAATWTDLATTATGTINITGLTASKSYEFQAAAQCTSGGTWTAWSASKTFNTTAVSTCAVPTTAQLSAINLATTTATLKSTQTGLVGYEWQYRKVGDATWIDLPSTATGTTNITGLAASSNYEFQGAAQCIIGGQWSAWSASKTFSTLAEPPCAAPTTVQLNTSNIAPTSATLNCTLAGKIGYDWRYRLAGAANWTDMASSATGTANLTGLVSSSLYEFQVSVQCTSVGAWSAWTGSQTFITTCVGPTVNQISATNVTATTATLNCALTGVVGYDWRYRIVGAAAWTDLAFTGTNTVNLTGLTGSKNYEFQVTQQCVTGGAWIAWSASQTFTTLVAPCNPPTTMQISASGITSTTANLNCTMTGVVGYDWRYRVVGAPNWIDLASTATSTSSITGLTASTNYEFQVLVQCTAGGSWSGWSASKTFATTALVCNAPTVAQLSTSRITNSSVVFNCSISSMISYDWRYRVVGTATWTDLTAGSAQSISASGLRALTNYEFQASIQCTVGGNWSAWSSSIAFKTTSSPCPAPIITDLTATNVTRTTAQLNCAVSGAQIYDWSYRVTGVSTWNSLGQTSTAFKQVTGLAGAKKYDFRVRLSCSGVFTAWSQVGTFTTPSSLVDETGSVDVAGSPTQPQLVLPPAMRIHPNPTRGELNLTYTLYEDSENVSVSIYDLNGRRLETIQMGAQNAGTYQHEFNPLPNSGLFLMRLNSGKSAAMQRFSVIK
jgi:hypothetical protein